MNNGSTTIRTAAADILRAFLVFVWTVILSPPPPSPRVPRRCSARTNTHPPESSTAFIVLLLLRVILVRFFQTHVVHCPTTARRLGNFAWGDGSVRPPPLVRPSKSLLFSPSTLDNHFFPYRAASFKLAVQWWKVNCKLGSDCRYLNS